VLIQARWQLAHVFVIAIRVILTGISASFLTTGLVNIAIVMLDCNPKR